MNKGNAINRHAAKTQQGRVSDRKAFGDLVRRAKAKGALITIETLKTSKK